MSSKKQKSKSHFFEHSLGAPFRNNRWSWGAISPSTGHVYLAVWKDDLRKVKGRPCVRVLDVNNPSRSHGYPERERHIQHIQAGAKAFGVIQTAVDPTASPRKTKLFNKKRSWLVVRFSKLMALSGSKMLIDAPHQAAVCKGHRELAATAADAVHDLQDGLFPILEPSQLFSKGWRWSSRCRKCSLRIRACRCKPGWSGPGVSRAESQHGEPGAGRLSRSAHRARQSGTSD